MLQGWVGMVRAKRVESEELWTGLCKHTMHDIFIR